MLIVDTSKEYAEVHAEGDVRDIAHDLIMITFSIARGMIQNKDFVSGMLLPLLVGNVLTDEDALGEILIGGKLDDSISSTTPLEGEDDATTQARAMANAMQKFTQHNPIKVDGDYNRIEEDEDV